MTRSTPRPAATDDPSGSPAPSDARTSSGSCVPSGSRTPDSREPSDFERPSSSLIGRLTLRSMNLWHTPLHRWGLAAAGIGADSRVLDVGCGGGGAVRRILRLTRAEVGAIDHSPAAVELTRRLNAAAAASGRLRVIEGSVEALPFRTGYFDVVTAFETVYFWPDLEAGLRETARVLGPGGRLVIVNEVADRRAAGIWADRLGMNVPDGDTLAEGCAKAGFARVDVRRHPRVGAWLRVVAGV